MSEIRINNDISYSYNLKNSTVSLPLQQTSRLLLDTNISDQVNSYQVYLNERSSSDRYRLILTINPFCTNVLFNACTEVVKNEGSDDVEIVTDNSSISVDNVMGKKDYLTRSDMIYNTEYSGVNVGYQYMPGVDIFDNHSFRNKTFKTVTRLDNRGDKFNTLEDYMRYSNGKQIKTYNRIAGESLQKAPVEINKHLYTEGDVYSFYNGDSINNSLLNINGWYGFKNHNSVETKDKYGEPMSVNRVLNNKNSDAFIDMYPDRSLFSFNPKKNTFKNRLEYNWDVFITYPYKNDFNHELVTGDYNGKKVNGLLVLTCEARVGQHGNDVIVIRTYSKHGLRKNDNVKVYVDGEVMDYSFRVFNVGNIIHDYEENYFIIDDENFLNEILKDNILDLYYRETSDIINDDKISKRIQYYNDKIDSCPDDDAQYISIVTKNNGVDVYKYYTRREDYIIKVNEFIAEKSLRIVRNTGGVDNSYYLRIFKKVPNWRYSSELLTYDTAIDRLKFDDFVKKNASENNKVMYDFQHETYKLGFCNTIYGDDATQLTYTDTIDIKNLYDNNGVGVHDLYITILKRNKGYEEWYNGGDKKNVEFSHCFGPLTCGFNFLRLKSDNKEEINKKMKKLGCISLYSLGDIDCKPLSLKYVTGDDNEFYGDLISCNNDTFEEKVIEDVYYRFNTAQRELCNDDKLIFTYHELEQDDYDPDGFKVSDYKFINREYKKLNIHSFNINRLVNDGGKKYYYVVTVNPSAEDGKYEEFYEWDKRNSKYVKKDGIRVGDVITRKEGYMYKGNYKIPVRELGDANYGSRVTARINDIQIIQDNALLFEITTNFKHKLSSGDIVYFCDDTNNIEYEIEVSEVINSVKFRTNIFNFNGDNWFTIIDKVKNNTLKIRFKNYDIPNYAKKIGVNRYIWRNVLHIGDRGVDGLTYPFANKSFYIDNVINFFLLRQDPHGYNNLFYESSDEIFGDIEGKKISENKNKYKDPDLYVVC